MISTLADRTNMLILKSNNDKITSGEFFIATLYATLFLLFLVFGWSLHQDHISLTFKISSALADSGMIVMICMFLKGKWRYIGVVITFVVGWLLLANILYFRNFEDLIQASSYINANISDSTITDGAISSFRASDLIFIMFPFCPLVYLICQKRKVFASPIRPLWKLGIATVCMLSWVFSYAGVYRRISLWNPDVSFKKVTEIIFTQDSQTWQNTYEMHNFTGYIVKCILSGYNIGMELSPADIDAIKSHLAATTRYRQNFVAESITMPRGQNLIMIIVESLPYKVIENPEASRLIPSIMKIVEDSSTIVSKCRVLANYGRSSDAQFIYNTGLLPLRKEALVDNYAFNDYPSIAKALGRRSIEIIGESKKLWVHSITTKSYGFDTLIDNIAPKGMDQDSIIFKRAEKEICQLKSPFFFFITTISMHDPYDERKVIDVFPQIEAEDERDREYYARLSHFDKSLEGFLSSLKQKGLYDDTVIVILGDHEIRESKISKRLHDKYVPFIVINSPLKCRRGILTTQLDVFPSILDMMEYEYTYLGEQYSGLGQSIFSHEAQSGNFYIPTDRDYEVSEMIIKGRPSMQLPTHK